MNVNYYNEFDKGAAAWLRELINAKLIPFGYVDERSITEVTASDVQGFTQCHFFAGIGGWSLALQLAGVPASTRLWTGSPPCQPFSTAGKQLGQFDERHLAPVFLNLISKCRPPVLFGEQVAAAIGKSWMCDLQTHLEGEDYAVGFTVLPACGVGAPHKRDRLFFGAVSLADSGPLGSAPRRQGWECSPDCEADSRGQTDFNAGTLCAPTDELAYAESKRPSHGRKGPILTEPAKIGGGCSSVADSNDTRPQGRAGMSERADQQPIGAGSVESGMGDSDSERHDGEYPLLQRQGEENLSQIAGSSENNTTNPHHGLWSDADWLGCRDGKFRPVEPGTFPLANGIPARVGRLRGYGNAIVPQVAAEFVKAFMSCEAP